MLAIIGGSGLAGLAGMEEVRSRVVDTPYGKPSGPLMLGKLGGREVAFLARHGEGHTVAPHEINYCANLWMIKEAGARKILAVAAVGGIRAEFGPGSLVVPHQIIDYTWGRRCTFFQGVGAAVTHIDFTEPYSRSIREEIVRAARDVSEPVHSRGVYAATQGPRLETAAEIDRLERDGADLVGMTGMPEAALARELGMEYAAIAVVVNHAAGRGDSAREISMEAIVAVLDEAMGRVHRIIRRMAEQ